jgi:hypothetical protein
VAIIFCAVVIFRVDLTDSTRWRRACAVAIPRAGWEALMDATPRDNILP